MKNILIEKNEAGQRLDRFLKKYYGKASLSYIYKMIRKDIKVNGRRVKEDTMLCEGDTISVYLSDTKEAEFRTDKRLAAAKKSFRSFKIAYEDEHILIAEKPFGLLTHGDAHEKKNHLTNQVISYLIDIGEYVPSREKTFVPAPANRLDRNTTGLVLFGKSTNTLRLLGKMLREKGYVSKYYLTIVSGALDHPLELKSKMQKDERTNTVSVLAENDEKGKLMHTNARPLKTAYVGGKAFTLVEVELVTGRTHQIRVHLAEAGYPIIGDAKYGDSRTNAFVSKKYGLTTQFLHAYRLCFMQGIDELGYLAGKEVICELPENLARIKGEIFSGTATVSKAQKIK